VYANCWQFMVSSCYLLINGAMTAFLVGEEWSRFACVYRSDLTRTKVHEARASRRLSTWLFKPFVRVANWFSEDLEGRVRKTLRVTTPEGIQRSSYFVHMPLRYGIPMLASITLQHYLVTQGIFVYATEPYPSEGSSDASLDLPGLQIGVAFSAPALIYGECCCMIYMFLLTCPRPATTLGFGYIFMLVSFMVRRYSETMPLASTCSAAISAACHPPNDDSEAYLFPLQCGVVSVDENGVGHCSLTTARDVFPPEVGKLYA